MSPINSKVRIIDSKWEEAKEFWEAELEKELVECNFPKELTRGEGYIEKNKYEMTLSEEIAQNIKKISNNSDFLTYSIMMTALHICLFLYKGEKRSCVLSPLTKEIDLKVNKLPMIVEMKPEEKTKSLLIRVKNKLHKVYEYQDYFPEFLGQEPSDNSELEFLSSIMLLDSNLHENIDKIKKPLALVVNNTSNTMSLVWEYSEGIYSEDSIIRFARHYTNVIMQMLSDLDMPVEEIELLSNEEKREILYEWQGEELKLPKNKSFIDFFEEQVRNYPKNDAVISQKGKLSYDELNSKVNHFTNILKEQGMASGDVIAIIATRSIESIIGILAIYKLGAIYLPIEPNYPIARQDYILTNGRAKKILVPKDYSERMNFKISTVKIDSEKLDGRGCEYFSDERSKTNSGYIIYTSGTTGKPKGVLIHNEELLNLCMWFKKDYNIDCNAKIILLIPFAFDASIKNIFTPLMCGGTLVLGPQNLFDTELVLEQVFSENITHLNCVPSLFAAILDTGASKKYKQLKSLRHVVLGGEVFRKSTLKSWVESDGFDCKISNVYGPTECTSVSTSYFVNKDDIVSDVEIPIGKPLPNKHVYVMDQEFRLRPIGVPGELYIGGIGTAKGYYEDDDNTEKAFIPDKYRKDRIIYKTGDIVKWRKDGNLLFIGREDNQVKLQGFRIELGEIESIINMNPRVQSSIVDLREDENGIKKLVAYIQPLNGVELESHEIRLFIKKWLPKYMVPSSYIFCKEFPLNMHGKIDRKALKKLKLKVETQTSKASESNTLLQKGLIEIWKNALNIKTVGLNDNFFDLGGYSLLLYRVSMDIEEKLNSKLSVVDLLEYPTIQSLSEFIEKLKEDNYKTVEDNSLSERANIRKNTLRRRKSLKGE
ncbi:non-ribosomal peptide synthetase [Wukongibacter sp. M2B1]|uniref:non-ribosomal peptide synthetase n=1 Tax=Wukongibacter sp. M2B1 TaxID=3088895 RepID=UPI003D7B1EFF